jgi:periplasmic divalent cation tolerance protein
MDAVTLYSTWPDRASAEAAAAALVQERLIACANILPEATSVFRWQDEVQRAAEVVMFAKTAAPRATAARDALIRLHPYDLPCVVALRLDHETSSSSFLTWIESETAPAA